MPSSPRISGSGGERDPQPAHDPMAGVEKVSPTPRPSPHYLTSAAWGAETHRPVSHLDIFHLRTIIMVRNGFLYHYSVHYNV